MFTILIFVVVFAAAVFSAESLVTTVAGFIVSTFGTQFVKNWLNAAGPGSVLIAIALSIGVAIVGIFAASYLGGEGLSVDALVKQSGQIFVLATLAYHLFRPTTQNS